MPPRPAKRPSMATPIKKRPPPPQSDAVLRELSPAPREVEEKIVPRVVGRSERLEVESKGGDRARIGMEEHIDAEVGYEEHVEERIYGDDMMEEMVEVEEEEEVEEDEEVGVEDVGDEHYEEVDGYGGEHHDVVKERRKRKEFEVFVGGLDRDATEEDLVKVFSQVGEITGVRLLKNPMTHKNKGFAFLRFATVEQARRAINELKHPMINGKPCGVAPSQDNDTLFVGNICKTWTKEALREKLAHYGIDNYEDLTLVEDTKNEGMNRGFAFLGFSSRADALEACKLLQKRDAVFGAERTARVAFADTFIEPDDEIMSHVSTVFLDGLPPTWDEDCIREHLKKFGRIEKVELARNMPAAKRIDFGFITFDTHEAAVACIDSINNAELGEGDRKVKIRARLSRPRQRGKSARHARGGYLVSRGYDRDGKVPLGSSSSRMDSRRFMDRSGRSILSDSAYDRDLKRSYDPRDRDLLPYRVGSGRPISSMDKSYGKKSPAYVKGSSRRDYIRQDEYITRSSDFARVPIDRHSYRDAYPSHESGFLESPPRSVSRGAARRPSPVHDDYSYGRYVERPSIYHDSHSRDYSSISSTKRPRSAIEDVHPRYAKPSIRQPRARFDYVGSSSSLQYSENSYGSDSTRLGRSSRLGYDRGSRSSAEDVHEVYGTRTSTMGYRRDEISRGDAERMYSNYDRDFVSRDYLPSRSDFGGGSYPPDYSSRRMNDSYSSGRGSGSYY